MKKNDNPGRKFDPGAILAKSDGKNLLEHIEDCLRVFRGLVQALPVIPSVVKTEDFFDILFCTVYLHDWGKAHAEFQKVLKKEENQWKHKRHEIFSVPFAEMLPFPEDQRKLIAQSVLGHHKDFESLLEHIYSEEEIEEYRVNFKSGINPADFRENLLNCLDVAYLLELKNRLQHYYDLYGFGKRRFAFGNIDFSSQENPVKTYARSYIAELHEFDEKQYWRQMLLSGAAKLCDHMGSAEISEIPRLMESNFDFLNSLEGKLYSHQEGCNHVNGNLFLMAPTGSGKTESALLWLRKQLQSGHQGRIFYVLPYTASINAMHQRLIENFEDKGIKPGNTEYIGILHGKLGQYLAEYFEAKDDNPRELQSGLAKIKDMHRQMVHPLKVITPFQILKFCYGVKGFEKGLTELAGALLVFDEIHAYDAQTFAQIVSCLNWLVKNLGIRVMIMTATLPFFMLRELQQAVGSSEVIKADDTLLEQFTRHRVQILEGSVFDQIPLIRDAIDKGQRVIVVCNTVANAQEIFCQLDGEEDTQKSVLLHSRFIAEHRLEEERLLFEEEENIQLLVGTQAIEVSLDIDFDILFTEPAPLDALIQRFGRINRKCGNKKGICPVYVCSEGGEYDNYIYPEDVVANTLRVLGDVSVIKEKLLQEMLDEVYPDWPEKDKYEETKAGFTESLSRLRPFMRHKEEEEAFYKRFTSVSVLPVDFQEGYKECMRQFDFIEAEKMFVSVHKGMFYKLLGKDLMEKDYVVIERKGRLKSIPYWVVKCRYDRYLGLLEEEISTSGATLSF